ncbi:hypothetical protein LOTGIDRAFT_237071 [Lottia gigantea]|uniref:Uncharacterized protein n=1 Tax=Lottia gigantea TaxID=225164 RepID=V3ZDW1_LOTGI|nr:hypothetical protein LOTGIDRAFT_237071 [Lottia gigantea]ESO82237.1 hypothetical protein LOTGIDRAFT_237071 [Lottia gigantea]
MAFHRGPHVRELFVTKDDNKKDKKTKVKNTKNVKEPPKFYQYTPKILTEDPMVNVLIPREDPVTSFTTSQPYIIGDKDVPIILHPISQEEDIPADYQEKDRPQRTRETSNPVFNKQEAARVEKSEMINGVVIPPPDYHDETIYAEIHERVDLSKPLHRHYGGEDFSKFLDEDDDSNHGGLTWRSEKPQPRSSIPAFEKKSKTEIKRPSRYQKRESKVKSLFGTSKSKTNTAKRHSQIRDFSFADSKTIVKDSEHVNLSRKISSSSDGGDVDNFINPLGKEQSYESFLEARHGYSDFSGDSAPIHGGGEYYDGPPSPLQKENNFWKRLTWRFRHKNNNSYYMAYE